METEAKFIVPNEAAFQRLRGLAHIGPYERRDTRVKMVHDRYLDTEDRRFYRQQLGVRLREDGDKEGGLLLTIKRLGASPQGAIHTRDEYQTIVPGLDINEWPEGEVKRLMWETAGDMPLREFVSLDQTRTVSDLYQGERAVAELSLDEVSIGHGQDAVRAYELEAEMLSASLAADLRILVRIFTEEYGLEPQPLSKLECAMLNSASEKLEIRN